MPNYPEVIRANSKFLKEEEISTNKCTTQLEQQNVSVPTRAAGSVSATASVAGPQRPSDVTSTFSDSLNVMHVPDSPPAEP